MSRDEAFPDLLARAIAQLAPSRATVSLRGGTAADRLAVARALHERSNRRSGAFRVVDCCTTETAPLESVFGGPLGQRASEEQTPSSAANRGTLYIVAVEHLPLLFQPRLMNFLDEHIRPRVVVSVGADLSIAVRGGRFRRDLAERLALIGIRCGPQT